MIQTFLKGKYETERLIIRPITLDDANDLFEISSNQNVVIWMPYEAHKSIEDSKWVIENLFLTNPANNLPQYTVMELKENHKMIGCCNFVSVKRGDIGEIGYQLNYNYWHQGYMSEAIKKVIEIGFTEIGFRKIEICHMDSNINSQNVIVSNGFVYEGTSRKEVFDKNKKDFADVKYYGMLKEEWERNKK